MHATLSSSTCSCSHMASIAFSLSISLLILFTQLAHPFIPAAVQLTSLLYCLSFHLWMVIFIYISHLHPWYLFQIVSYPDGTQAASLDIAKAYCNSPISPLHKPYIAVMWDNQIWTEHCVIFSLALSGDIQGTVADALINVLKHHSTDVTMKWVDNFIFFCSPSYSLSILCHNSSFVYSFDLNTIIKIMTPLRILWHPPSVKGNNFNFGFLFIGFSWHCAQCTVSLPEHKCLKILPKVISFIQLSTHHVTC